MTMAEARAELLRRIDEGWRYLRANLGQPWEDDWPGPAEELGHLEDLMALLESLDIIAKEVGR